MVHRIARAYGKWPHEVEELTPYQLTMAKICLERADVENATAIRDTAAMPVWIAGGIGGR